MCFCSIINLTITNIVSCTSNGLSLCYYPSYCNFSLSQHDETVDTFLFFLIEFLIWGAFMVWLFGLIGWLMRWFIRFGLPFWFLTRSVWEWKLLRFKVAEGYVQYTVMLLAIVCLLLVWPTLTYEMAPPWISTPPSGFQVHSLTRWHFMPENSSET